MLENDCIAGSVLSFQSFPSLLSFLHVFALFCPRMRAVHQPSAGLFAAILRLIVISRFPCPRLFDTFPACWQKFTRLPFTEWMHMK